MAIGPDGGLYISEYYRLRWIGPDGIIGTVAGTGSGGLYLGDDTIANQLPLISVQSVAVAPDGTLYLSVFYLSYTTARILRLRPAMLAFLQQAFDRPQPLHATLAALRSLLEPAHEH